MDGISHTSRLVAWTGSEHLAQSRENHSSGPSDAVSPAYNKKNNNQHRPFYKSAQWSPDGTSILTSTADNQLRTYILPPDLLSSASGQQLAPYAIQSNPEPVYASAFHPSYSLQDAASTLYVASVRALPTRLYSPFSPTILASYPLISPTTEEHIAPHSLLFSLHNPNTFFAGSLNLISVFDINRNGEGPVERMRTVPSKRSTVVGGMGRIKGIISALGMSSEGILAAGTFGRWVGLYDGYGRGGSVGVFEAGGDTPNGEETYGGTGVTQVAWSGDGRYLCVTERCSHGISVWDIRGTGQRLAWLKGRNAKTNQRLGMEIVGGEVWAGGADGVVRLWEGLGTKAGTVEPTWEFKAHDDAISSTTWHFSGSVLATCSGHRHFDDPKRTRVEDSDNGSSEACSTPSPRTDDSLKIWSF